MNLKLFFTRDKFGLLIALCSMADRSMHGSSTCLVNITDIIQLEIECTVRGLGMVNCEAFVISNSQFNIQGRQLESVQF